MKSWSTAAVPGSCAFCARPYRKDERVVVVQGATWRKTYCGPCGKQRHGMPDDTGEYLDITDDPSYPTPLKSLAAQALERFAPQPDGEYDHAKAAAKDGE